MGGEGNGKVGRCDDVSRGLAGEWVSEWVRLG